jgi:hypothetical protein
MEYDHFTVAPKGSTVSDSSLLDDEEAHATMDGRLLSSLVGVVSEVVLDETELISLYDLRASGRNSKTSNEKRSAQANKIQNCFPMNGMFSNSRGLGDLAKHVYVVDCYRDHNLDFVALSKWVDEITHQVFLTALLVVLTLSGCLDRIVAVQVASLSAYGLIPWKYWQV